MLQGLATDRERVGDRLLALGGVDDIGDVAILDQVDDMRSALGNLVDVLAVKADMQDDPRVQKLFKLLTSQDMKDFIESEFKGLVIPAS